MRVSEFQKKIEEIYLAKDSARGIEGTFMWFVEEVGELARAIKGDDPANLEEEFADVMAWLASMASIQGIDLAAVITKKYGSGCPRCESTPCQCSNHRPPQNSQTQAPSQNDNL